MTPERREAIRQAGGLTVMSLALAAGLLRPRQAHAADWNKAAFEAKDIASTVKALGGTAAAVESKDITATAPDIAENGAVVPVAVVSKLPKTESIAILVEKNPNTLTAAFLIPAGTDPNVSTRVKMGESSFVRVVAEAGGKHFSASKEVKITIGGCGG